MMCRENGTTMEAQHKIAAEFAVRTPDRVMRAAMADPEWRLP